MEYSSLFVTLMGIGTVFFGLICIIFLTMAMGAILKGKEKTPAVAAAAPAAAPAPVPAPQGMQPEIVGRDHCRSLGRGRYLVPQHEHREHQKNLI